MLWTKLLIGIQFVIALPTERFTDLDKLNLVKFAYSGLVLDSKNQLASLNSLYLWHTVCIFMVVQKGGIQIICDTLSWEGGSDYVTKWHKGEGEDQPKCTHDIFCGHFACENSPQEPWKIYVST